MQSKYFFIISILLLLGCSDGKETQSPKELVLENKTSYLKIELQGGMFTDFHLKDNPANPFTWKATPEQMPANNRPHVFKGHFLCTGRWGAPSKMEIEAGIPHNGEINTRLWTITKPTAPENDMYLVEMSCNAPLEKLDVIRLIQFPENGSYFIVTEKFTNKLAVGKQTNFVHHPTIAAPFLTGNTIINSNAHRGFDQKTPIDSLEEKSFVWPNGIMDDGTKIDLQTVTSEKGYVTSHIFSDDVEIGWITALNPNKNLLLGYIWKTNEYPWLNVWHHSQDGKPFAQGLEFGTTGMGNPYRELLENKISFFGRNPFEFIDAGETITKSFICFQIEVPKGFDGVKKINIKEDFIEIEGKNKMLTSFEVNRDILKNISSNDSVQGK